MRDSIITRIECALEKARWRKLELRGLYLDHEDYADFAYAETVAYQKATGSAAMLWPLSYENALILSGKVLSVEEAGDSAVYATSGEKISVPKRLRKRVAA